MNSNLNKELQELVEENVISAEVSIAISAYYASKQQEQPNRLFAIFGVLGSLLTGLGIILILAHNWDDFSVATKTIWAFVPLVVGEKGTDASGKQDGAGWAGVLQSGLANSALEAAEAVGADIDKEVLKRTRDYQKDNYDASTGNVKTDDGAGVMLYAVSGSVRASAKQARKAEEAIEKANKNGDLEEETVTVQNLEKAGYSKSEAIEYAASYNVYQSAKATAQREDVLNGFGNNGGEEFLSFLQTGESLVVNKDKDWKQWYDGMSGRILKIQNEDGSWNGHHCITSPVFCTATSILLLTVENDIQFLRKVGA